MYCEPNSEGGSGKHATKESVLVSKRKLDLNKHVKKGNYHMGKDGEEMVCSWSENNDIDGMKEGMKYEDEGDTSGANSSETYDSSNAVEDRNENNSSDSQMDSNCTSTPDNECSDEFEAIMMNDDRIDEDLRNRLYLNELFSRNKKEKEASMEES
mmetsp:Transcript_20746/g.29821  ORF Transcript_20746/g.29821 Transcript_20746/m.29821 type:complete len:155 (+) Transcript_20746:133-597(+)|eukprot:CAMPEP_0185024268 /NCGR_PEP_ID=MMETSP1103-20130426/7273_1 /TAXON_ID=36769 /ORGANISM="Paraphysomonas bandaiensis, Strain Caron Lab Isolate" /LENGTH=154 /DNA_ID=CAMNT_0027557189 /DNA_START=95 /DNA_END=559 /DNA_ORIENTATION=-